MVEAAVASAERPDDPVVFGGIPFEIEVAHEDRIGRHRRHLAFGPSRLRLRMTAAPRTAFARGARVDGEERFDLRQSRHGTQVTEMHGIDTHRPGAFGDDHRFEGALLDAVLRERSVFRQQVVAR